MRVSPGLCNMHEPAYHSTHEGAYAQWLRAAEVGNEALHIARNLLKRIVSRRRHTVADVPVLYFIAPDGIAFLEIGFMLGFLQSNDVMSRLQIALPNLERKTLSPDAGNPQGAQGVEGEW